MLQPIFTSLRRLFVPQFMRNIDQYLLTHHALVWETRVHWFTLYATALLLLLVGAGCCVLISFPDEIILFETIEKGLAMVQAIVTGIVGLFFLLLVNGLFARFFKTGFIATNQKFRPIDFFKLGGIYGFMLVFAAVVCSAYHYTLIVRTHFIINQKQNYTLLDKYAKLYEFYRQDTLRIKGFETIEPYINMSDLEYSTIRKNHSYSNKYGAQDTDPRIIAYNADGIKYAPINQALQPMLPKDITFYKIRKNTFDAVEIMIKPIGISDGECVAGLSEHEIDSLIETTSYHLYHDNGYHPSKIPLVKSSDISKNIVKETCGFAVEYLSGDLTQYCRFTHYSLPHTRLYDSTKHVVLDADTVSTHIVKKMIDPSYYENHNNYWRFFAKQSIGISVVAVFFVVLLLSFHAYQSFRFFSLVPAAVPFTAVMIEEFTGRHGGKDTLIISMAVFYILFALCTILWHRKVYTTNPLKFAIIYSVLAMLCSVPLLQIAPYLTLNQEVLSATQIVVLQNMIVPVLLIIHILCYILLLLGRNTRVAVVTPFLYFVAFIWSLLPNTLHIYGYGSTQSTVEPNFLVNLCSTFAFVPFFLLLNLLTAPFLLSAIVRQTQQPK